MTGRQEALRRSRTSPPAACLAACALLVLAGLDSRGAGTEVPSPAVRGPVLIGSVELRPCGAVSAYCGRLDRPLDPTGAIPGRISIHFEFHPHFGREKSAGTLVATEGGPGYPATGTRDDYLALFEPLRRRMDVLLMDNRGTGQSGAIDCRELQAADKWTVSLIGACGRSLGDTAPLYSTAYAADDLAAILDALNIRRIDLYGDSYGTYFAQVFAVRHPNVVRSLVLDGAYPLNGRDYPWYPDYAPAMRRKFNVACRRFAPCARLPGTAIDHILPVLEELRSHPFAARAAGGDGRQRDFTADAPLLATVMFAGAPAFATVRELDAAARAFSAGDRAPLLRLMAETLGAVDSRDPAADPTAWSAGLAAAVMCQDPPQIFDMRLAPEQRAADRDRALAARRLALPETYAPFTIDEYRGMPLDYSFIDQCVEWPVAPSSHPASRVVAADAAFPDVPALVISGELDDLTTTSDGAAVAAAFKHGTQVRVANSFHVNALRRARSSCAARIVRRFIGTLTPGDDACAAAVPPLRLAADFARQASQVDPAAGTAGNQAGAVQLRLASAAVLTAGDVLARLGGNSAAKGVGLRGGHFRVVRDAATEHVELTDVRWTSDLAVSGSINRPASPSGVVRASLQLTAADGSSGAIRIAWPEGVAHSTAAIHGTVGGAVVIARMPAP